MTSTAWVWESLPAVPRNALAAGLAHDVPAEALALYARWWQLETWLRSLAYVELRARAGITWSDSLDTGTINRQAKDQQYRYMASPDWEDPLSYLDASKLFDLIEANWELFEPTLIELDAWKGRRAELIKIRHRIGHLRRAHQDDLGRIEQTLRDLDKGALDSVLAYHRKYDAIEVCRDDDPVVRAWIRGEHDDADRLVEHAASNYETYLRIGVTARPWATYPPDDESLESAAPGFLWYVEFWSTRRYLRVPEMWRDSYLDKTARKMLVHMVVPNIKTVIVTFPMKDDGIQIADAIGNLFDTVLVTSTEHYPGNLEDISDDPLSRLPALDSRVQVNSMWSAELPEGRPISMFSA